MILSTNARPIPAISFDRRIAEPFESKCLSWIGPWSFHSFIGRDGGGTKGLYPIPYLWGIRIDVNPTILDGLEVGMFRMMQLGGEGRPEGLSTWVDAFLSQDNVGANSKYQDKILLQNPVTNWLALDIRWRPWEAPFASLWSGRGRR